MRRFMISFLKFVLFSSVFYTLMIILWGEFSPVKKNSNLYYRLGMGGHSFTRMKEAKSFKNVDLLFVGSSHAYRGFDNRIYKNKGYKSFLLASNSQTSIQSKYLLKRYLPTLNPKLVIIEICPFVFSLDGVESSLVLMANDEVDFETFKMVKNQKNLKIYNSLVYSIYRNWIHDDLINFKEEVQRNNDTYIHGGFLDKSMQYYESQIFEKQVWTKNSDILTAFNDMITMLNENQIPFILVQSPVTKDLYNSYDNNDDFDKLMNLYGGYYNYNQLIELNDSLDFMDYHHLNNNGVKKFNEELLITIERMQIIND